MRSPTKHANGAARRSRVRGPVATWLLAALAVGAPLACDSSYATRATPGDAGADADGAACGSANLLDDAQNCGSCGHACAALQQCASGACVPGCSQGIVYVSPSGSDANDGCTPRTPKNTIGAAVSEVRAVGARSQEIHVCKGTFAETVTLDYPVSLLGSYDCATWSRPVDYGYPTFGSNTATILTGAPGNTTGVTLSVSVPTDDAGSAPPVVIDGMRVLGPPTATYAATAIGIAGPAPVTLSNDQAVGGSGTTALDHGSAGIITRAGAAPDIGACSISGGSGTSTLSGAVGSVGVLIRATSGAPHVHDATIAGGSGTSDYLASVGVYLGITTRAASVVIERSAIDGGTGHLTAQGPVAAAVATTPTPIGADLTLSSDTLTGGHATCDTSCDPTGVNVATTGAFRMLGNRVYGGDVQNGANNTGRSRGVRVAGYASLEIAQNLIHAGSETKAIGAASALEIDATQPTTGGLVAHNTLRALSGPLQGVNGLAILGPVGGLSVTNNLVLGDLGGSSDYGVFVDACAGVFADFSGNAFVGAPQIAAMPTYSTGACGSPQPISSITLLATRFGSEAKPPTMSHDAAVEASCASADTGAGECVACMPGACTVAILTSAAKRQDLLGATGFAPKDSGPCLVLQGGVDLTASYPTDLLGVKRTAPVTIGAQENDGACSP